MTQDPRPSPKQSPNPNDRSALLQAFQDVVRDQKDKQAQASDDAQSEPRHTYSLIMFGLAVVLVATLVLQPAWLFPRPVPESTELREASLRVRMYVEITRVEQFRAANGQLPASLLEAGADTSGLRYTPSQRGYVLTGVNQGVTLSYTSGTPPDSFLGNSYAVITHRRRL